MHSHRTAHVVSRDNNKSMLQHVVFVLRGHVIYTLRSNRMLEQVYIIGIIDCILLIRSNSIKMN